VQGHLAAVAPDPQLPHDISRWKFVVGPIVSLNWHRSLSLIGPASVPHKALRSSKS
jgi:hypothetical protein